MNPYVLALLGFLLGTSLTSIGFIAREIELECHVHHKSEPIGFVQIPRTVRQ